MIIELKHAKTMWMIIPYITSFKMIIHMRYRGWSSRMWESRYQLIWKNRALLNAPKICERNHEVTRKDDCDWRNAGSVKDGVQSVGGSFIISWNITVLLGVKHNISSFKHIQLVDYHCGYTAPYYHTPISGNSHVRQRSQRILDPVLTLFTVVLKVCKSTDVPKRDWCRMTYHLARLILDGYFNPLVFWYQWEYLLTSKEFNFLQGI